LRYLELLCVWFVCNMEVDGGSGSLFRVERVDQLESIHLDSEFHQIFYSQLLASLPFLPSSSHPKLLVLIKSLFFLLSTARNQPTPGMIYHNLEYSSPLSIPQRILQYTFSILVSPSTLSTLLPANHPLLTSSIYTNIHIILKLFSLINFSLFLIFGGQSNTKIQRSLLHTILNIKLKHSNPNAKRSFATELLSSALLWERFSELALFIAPTLLSIRIPIQSIFKSFLSFIFGIHTTHQTSQPPQNIQSRSNNTPELSCGICHTQTPKMIYINKHCKCTFCYICISIYNEHQNTEECPNCQQRVGITIERFKI